MLNCAPTEHHMAARTGAVGCSFESLIRERFGGVETGCLIQATT